MRGGEVIKFLFTDILKCFACRITIDLSLNKRNPLKVRYTLIIKINDLAY